ncbi:hypothetical protein NHG25_08595 [Aerococcaceae bacterium NML191292]|nr:hypothetical protein [Aerococcaceae bacterium NML191292]
MERKIIRGVLILLITAIQIAKHVAVFFTPFLMIYYFVVGFPFVIMFLVWITGGATTEQISLGFFLLMLPSIGAFVVGIIEQVLEGILSATEESDNKQ